MISVLPLRAQAPQKSPFFLRHTDGESGWEQVPSAAGAGDTQRSPSSIHLLLACPSSGTGTGTSPGSARTEGETPRMTHSPSSHARCPRGPATGDVPDAWHQQLLGAASPWLSLATCAGSAGRVAWDIGDGIWAGSQLHTPAAWSRGMVLASGAGGPGSNCRTSPAFGHPPPWSVSLERQKGHGDAGG